MSLARRKMPGNRVGEARNVGYTELCRIEGWSVSTLRRKIDSMLFERTAVSRKPEKLARKELDAL